MTDKVIASLIAPPLIAGYKVFDVFGGKLAFETDGVNVTCYFFGDINDKMTHTASIPCYELEAWKSAYTESELDKKYIIDLQPVNIDIRHKAYELELDDIELQMHFDSDLVNISVACRGNTATKDWCRKNHGTALTGTEKWLRLGVKYYVPTRIVDGSAIDNDTDLNAVPVD